MIKLNGACDSGCGVGYFLSELGLVGMDTYYYKLVVPCDIEKFRKYIGAKLDYKKVMVRWTNPESKEEETICIGDFAVLMNEDRAKRRTIKDRVGDPMHLLQILTLIGLGTKEYNYVELNLGVALPNHLRHKKKECKEWLKGEHKITFLLNGDKEITKTIKINESICLTQPICPLLSIDEFERNLMNYLSLDFGHVTVDGALMLKGEVLADAKDFLTERGMVSIYQRMDQLIRREIKGVRISPLSEKTLQVTIETGKFKIKPSNIKSVEHLLRSALSELIEDIFVDIENRYGSIINEIDIVLVSGGVAANKMFIELLNKKFSKYKGIIVEPVENPQEAIVRGIYAYINEVFEDDFNDDEIIEGGLNETEADAEHKVTNMTKCLLDQEVIDFLKDYPLKQEPSITEAKVLKALMLLIERCKVNINIFTKEELDFLMNIIKPADCSIEIASKLFLIGEIYVAINNGSQPKNVYIANIIDKIDKLSETECFNLICTIKSNK